MSSANVESGIAEISRPGISPLPTRQTLTDDVYEAIKALIMDHVIEPESRLSIDKLARDLHVSPTPIREALARLESEGLAVKEALRGYFTTAVLGQDQLNELFEFRNVIEPWAAARAARRRTPEQLQQLGKEMDSIKSLPSGESYDAYRELANMDNRFHLMIAELSGNRHVALAFARTHCHLHLFRLAYSTRLGASAVREHHVIFDAIAAGDGSAARAAMLNHLKLSRGRFVGDN